MTISEIIVWGYLVKTIEIILFFHKSRQIETITRDFVTNLI